MKRGLIKNIIASVLAIGVSLSVGGCKFTDYIANTSSDSALTAYELAVKNGFKGTEQQWLASLKGADGKDANSPTIDEIYESWVTKSGNEGKTFNEFLKEYLSVTVGENNDTDILFNDLRSAMAIYCGFTVTTTTSSGFGWNSRPSTSISIVCSAGSGVITNIDRTTGNATVITNYHVVYDAEADTKLCENIYLYPYGSSFSFNTATGKDSEGGDGIKATCIGGSMTYDIAVLEVQGSDYFKTDFPLEAEFGDSDKLKVGEKVYTAGNPEGDGLSITNGLLSVDSEYISLTGADEKTEIDFRVMRTDAAINGGNSGGGLYDADGKLIGITNAKLHDHTNTNGSMTYIDNMGYALPINQVKAVVENIKNNSANGFGKVNKAMFGIMVQTTNSSCVYDNVTGGYYIKETVKVTEETSKITNSSAAYGKLKDGDILTCIEINGTKVTTNRRYQFIESMLYLKKGDTAKVYFVRDGVEQTAEVLFDKDEYFTAIA